MSYIVRLLLIMHRLELQVAISVLVLHFTYGVETVHSPSQQDTCVLSLVVPRQSISTSCTQNERLTQKLMSLENQLLQTVSDLDELKHSVSLSRTNSEQNSQKMALDFQELQNKFRDLEKKCIELHDDQGQKVSRTTKGNRKKGSRGKTKGKSRTKDLSSQIKSVIRAEVTKAKDEIIFELLASEFSNKQTDMLPNTSFPQTTKETVGGHDSENVSHPHMVGQRSTNGERVRQYPEGSAESAIPGTSSETAYELESKPRKRRKAWIEDDVSQMLDDSFEAEKVTLVPKVRDDSYQKENIPNKSGEMGQAQTVLFSRFSKSGKNGNFRTSKNKHNQERKHFLLKQEHPQNIYYAKVEVKGLINILHEEIAKTVDKQCKIFNTTESKMWASVHQKFSDVFESIEMIKDQSAKEIRKIKMNQRLESVNTNSRFSKLETDVRNCISGVMDMSNSTAEYTLKQVLKEHANPEFTKQNLTDLIERYRLLHNYQKSLVNTVQSHQNASDFNFKDIENNFTSIHKTLEKLNSSIFVQQSPKSTEDAATDSEQAKNKLENLEQVVIGLLYNILSPEGQHGQKDDRSPYLTEAGFSVSNVWSDSAQKDKNFKDVMNTLFQSIKASIKDQTRKQYVSSLTISLTTTEWAPYNFSYQERQTFCSGKRLVKKSGYKIGQFVGVVLCSPTRYKIFLSDSLLEEFQIIGDEEGKGENHCEFVGATPDNRVQVGPIQYTRTKGYKRSSWGEVPRKGTFFKLSISSPSWYECDVSVP